MQLNQANSVFMLQMIRDELKCAFAYAELNKWPIVLTDSKKVQVNDNQLLEVSSADVLVMYRMRNRYKNPPMLIAHHNITPYREMYGRDLGEIRLPILNEDNTVKSFGSMSVLNLLDRADAELADGGFMGVTGFEFNLEVINKINELYLDRIELPQTDLHTAFVNAQQPTINRRAKEFDRLTSQILHPDVLERVYDKTYILIKHGYWLLSQIDEIGLGVGHDNDLPFVWFEDDTVFLKSTIGLMFAALTFESAEQFKELLKDYPDSKSMLEYLNYEIPELFLVRELLRGKKLLMPTTIFDMITHAEEFEGFTIPRVLEMLASWAMDYGYDPFVLESPVGWQEEYVNETTAFVMEVDEKISALQSPVVDSADDILDDIPFQNSSD